MVRRSQPTDAGARDTLAAAVAASRDRSRVICSRHHRATDDILSIGGRRVGGSIMRVLVTWGSKRGGTEGIARTIADQLQRDGLEVVAAPACKARGAHGCGAVVVGGALYANRWPASAGRVARIRLSRATPPSRAAPPARKTISARYPRISQRRELDAGASSSDVGVSDHREGHVEFDEGRSNVRDGVLDGPCRWLGESREEPDSPTALPMARERSDAAHGLRAAREEAERLNPGGSETAFSDGGAAPTTHRLAADGARPSGRGCRWRAN